MAVLGHNSIGASDITSARWYSSKFTSTEAGTITDFAAYLASTGIADFQFVIYNDNAGIPGSTILAQSSSTAFDTTPAWKTGSISYTFAASETMHFYIMANDQIRYFYDSGAVAQTAESTEDFGNWPTAPTPPTNTATYDVQLSLYVNYTPASSDMKVAYLRV